MSEAGSIDIQLDKTMQDPEIAGTSKDDSDKNNSSAAPQQSSEPISVTDKKMLTVAEIFSISKNYDWNEDWQDHAPKTGQLSLQEATAVAVNTVKSFSTEKILPSFFADRAYNQTALLRTLIVSEGEDILKMGCWLITFTSEDERNSLELYLNAVTGQVLGLTATYSSDLQDDSGDNHSILTKYVDYLGIDQKTETPSFWSDASSAVYYFKNYQSGITVKKIIESEKDTIQLIIKTS